MTDGIREGLVDIIRASRIGPFGPNSLAVLVDGGVTHLTPGEAEDITDRILGSALLAGIQAAAWDEGTRAVTIQRDGFGGIIPAPSDWNPYCAAAGHLPVRVNDAGDLVCGRSTCHATITPEPIRPGSGDDR